MGDTQGMYDSTFFTEIFAEVVLKGRLRIAERPFCGPLRTLRFIAGKGIEDVISGTCKQTGRSAEKTLNGVCPSGVDVKHYARGSPGNPDEIQRKNSCNANSAQIDYEADFDEAHCDACSLEYERISKT